MEKKIVNHNFYMADFDREARWLEDQNKAGLKLISANGAHYEFEQCRGGEWLYEIDFRRKGEEEDAFIKKITKSGWEYVCKYNTWYYFRRKKTQGKADFSVFNDREDKFQVCREVIKKDIYKMMPLYILGVVYLILCMFTSVFRWNAIASNISFIIGFLVAMFLSFAIEMNRQEYKRLKKLTTPEEEMEVLPDAEDEVKEIEAAGNVEEISEEKNVTEE